MKGVSQAIGKLVQSTATKVSASAESAAVASRPALQKAWAKLSDDDRRSLAELGLTSLVNDELSARRKRFVDEQLAIHRAAEEKREEEIRKQREEYRKSQGPDPRALTEALPQQDIERLHDMMGSHCTCTTHHRGKPGLLRKCVVCFCSGLSMDERETKASALRQEAEESRDGMWRAIEGHVNVQAAKRAQSMLPSITLVCADGKTRSLFEFKTADLAKCEADAARKEKAWSDRRDWFAEAAAKLSEHGAGSISELPSEAFVLLATKAESIWKKTSAATDEATPQLAVSA